MSDESMGLTRRKVLASLGGIGAAGAAAGYGTTALYTDIEESQNNTLAAGELDLKVDWEEHYSFPQLYGFDDPADGLDVTRSEPDDTSDYVGLPDPDYPVVWANSEDGDPSSLDQYMSNTAIEAFPDPDDDGEQEVETDSFTYEPCNDGADMPDDLDVGGLRSDNAHTNPDGNGGSPPLIQLEDVKPGDFGEFTFSFHLCDNPGYVWLQAANFSEDGGANPESEPQSESNDNGELAENIRTVWWYDARGDNIPPRTDCEGAIYLTNTFTDNTSPTELYEVDLTDNPPEADMIKLLDAGSSGGNFTQTDAIAATPFGDEVLFYDKGSSHLGEYDVNTGMFSDLGEISNDPGGVVLAGYSASGTLWAASQDNDHLYTVDRSVPEVTDQGDTGVDLSGADLAFAADGTMYLWVSEPSNDDGLYEVDDPSSDPTADEIGDVSTGTDVTGMAILDEGNGNLVVSDNNTNQIIEVDRTTGTEVEQYDMSGDLTDHIFGDMTSGQLCGEVFRRGNPEIQGDPNHLKDDITAIQDSKVPLDGNRATPFEEFTDNGDDPNRECFAADVTHYIGFGWWLPADVGNEVQGDTVSFDLGFYTEQCRNNGG